MNNLFQVSLIGFLTGIIGTGLGGAASFVIKGKSNKFLSFILEFSAGLMLAVVCFDLLPEAFEIGSLKTGILGVLFGIAMIVFIEEIMDRLKLLRKNNTDNNLVRVGSLLGIGIALHNLPEGIAIGSGFGASMDLGIGLAIVIALHDIPEGLVMAVPLKIGNMNIIKIILLTMLSGVPTFFGAFLGALIGQISSTSISICLGFAGGAMLYIVSGELIPESKKIYRGRMSTFGNIIGIIIGIIISCYRI